MLQCCVGANIQPRLTLHLYPQKTLGDWERYEGEKTEMLAFMKQAEAELEKPPATSGHELAKKDYTTKKVRR